MALGSTQFLVKMSTRNIPGCKGGRCERLTISPTSGAEYHEIWEPKPPGTLWTTPGLLRDCFTFCTYIIIKAKPIFHALCLPTQAIYLLAYFRIRNKHILSSERCILSGFKTHWPRPNLKEIIFLYTRWFEYDRDWFVCKQAALRNSCATLRAWSHKLHPPSCSG